MNTKSKKEIDAYFKRVEDPTNYTTERWWYLINSWNDHIYRIMLEKKWVDDDSTYYKMLIEQLKDIYEAPIEAFVDYWVKNAPTDFEYPNDIGEMVTTWSPCTKDSAMSMFEDVMEVFEEAWKEADDAKNKLIEDALAGNLVEDVIDSDFVDIQYPDNWEKLKITFKESDITQMKYKYDGKESDWIDVSSYIMRKGTNVPVLYDWFKTILVFCTEQYFKLPDGTQYDLTYHSNVLLKKWFLPNAQKGLENNPIFSKGTTIKHGISTTRYDSLIEFSYQP